MKIAIVTDAWRPQTNGVVTTLTRTAATLAAFGHEVAVMAPEHCRTVPCPTYPEIRLALFPGRQVAEWLEETAPDALHVATEGPLGYAARAAALRTNRRFTTSFHTQFPEYLAARFPLPRAVSYAALRRFHGVAERTMVGTRTVREALKRHGFTNLVQWTRGVDTAQFRPSPARVLDLPRPVLVYAGRLAVEKGIEDFLRADVPGTKVVIGGGPAHASLRARFPHAVYTGYLYGDSLAAALASADCFVFPSRTDTFGLVMLEALACGVPVAAYPVGGPIDVIRDGEVGCLREDLATAIRGALELDPERCRAYALGFRWEHATREFLGNLVESRGRLPLRHWRPRLAALRRDAAQPLSPPGPLSPPSP
jgi:glycosyltransferase involved in cell wall biosynthesis